MLYNELLLHSRQLHLHTWEQLKDLKMRKKYRRNEAAIELLHNLKCRRQTVLEIKIFEHMHNMHIIFQIMGGEKKKEWRPHNGLQISRLSSSQPGNMDFLSSAVLEYSSSLYLNLLVYAKAKAKMYLLFLSYPIDEIHLKTRTWTGSTT